MTYLKKKHRNVKSFRGPIVVENAPMGVQAGAAAGIFTVAVNTGPIDGQVLLDAGANVLFPSMQDFCDNWENLRKAFE